MHGTEHRAVMPKHAAQALLAALLAILIALLAYQQLIAVGPIRRKKDMEAAQIEDAIGATLEPLGRDTARMLGVEPPSAGLVVTSVSRSGAAWRAGIRTGDVMEAIGRTPVRSVDDAASELRAARGTLTVTLNRHHHYAIVRLAIPSDAERRQEAD